MGAGDRTLAAEGGNRQALSVSVASVFIPVFALWPVIAFLGGTGASLLAALAGLGALVFIRPRLRVSLPIVLLMAFLIWAGVTQIWSPTDQPIVSGDLLAGNFGVNSAVVKIGLLAALALVGVAAAQSAAPVSARRSLTAAQAGFALQVAGLVVIALFTQSLLQLFAPISDPLTAASVNITRNAVLCAPVLPVLLAPLWARRGVSGKLAALALAIAVAFLLQRLDASAGALGALAGTGGAGLAMVWPRRALAILLALAAALILAAPLWVWGLVDLGMGSLDSLHVSNQSRLWCWDWVLGRLGEAPLLGHGLQASKTWTLVLSELPGWHGPAIIADYPVVPGHPHNMPLQIWAETGLIGAVLAASGVLALAWQLREGDGVAKPARIAACMLVATILIPFCVSFSAWNDAFWGCVALSATAVVLMARAGRVFP